jgi:hypothetical protein
MQRFHNTFFRLVPAVEGVLRGIPENTVSMFIGACIDVLRALYANMELALDTPPKPCPPQQPNSTTGNPQNSSSPPQFFDGVNHPGQSSSPTIDEPFDAWFVVTGDSAFLDRLMEELTAEKKPLPAKAGTPTFGVTLFEGEKYLTRYGRVVGPLIPSSVWIGAFETKQQPNDRRTFFYNEHGECWIEEPGFRRQRNSGWDIVAHYIA